MHIEERIEIDAPVETVWPILSDVERWPTWTASIRSVKRKDDGPLAVGSAARVKQPKLPPTIWQVTDVVPGRSFTWEAKSPGIRSVGFHGVSPHPGGVTVVLSLHQSGPLGAVLERLIAKMSRRYVRMEAEGLKRHAEASARDNRVGPGAPTCP